MFSDEDKVYITEQVRQEFPNLFREYFLKSKLYVYVRYKLEEEVADSVEKVREAADREVSNIVENSRDLVIRRIAAIEGTVKDLDNKQAYTFTGGLLLGVSAMLLYCGLNMKMK